MDTNIFNKKTKKEEPSFKNFARQSPFLGKKNTDESLTNRLSKRNYLTNALNRSNSSNTNSQNGQGLSGSVGLVGATGLSASSSIEDNSNDNNQSQSSNAEEALKGMFKKKAGLGTALKVKIVLGIITCFATLLIVMILGYFILNPLAALRTIIFDDPAAAETGSTKTSGWDRFWNSIGSGIKDIICDVTGSCTVEQEEKKIYSEVKSKTEALSKKNIVYTSKVNPYLAMSTIFYSSGYDVQDVNNDSANAEINKNYFDEAKRMLDVITVEGEGLTKKVWYCINSDDENKTYNICGLSGKNQNECSTTCTKDVENKDGKNYYEEYANYEPRSDEEYELWLVASGELEKHFIELNISLPSNEDDKQKALTAAAKVIVSQKDIYGTIYNDYTYASVVGNYGFEGGKLTGEENVVLSAEEASSLWSQIAIGNPFYTAGIINGYDPRQCTTFAYWRFLKYYGYPAGATGNGNQWAEQVVAAHPDKFVLSDNPAPGAIYSLYGGDNSNHVGFVEKVEGDYMWISDGNVNNYGIRLNYKMAIAGFNSGYVKYAVPIQ
jgi:surface antigen